MPEEILDKKGIIKAVIVAVIIALAGIFVLSLIYHQTYLYFDKKLSDTEQVFEEYIEEREARDILEQFTSARIGKNENIAKGYLTERAMEQLSGGEFFLTDNFVSYEVFSGEKLSDERYRFAVRLYREEVPKEIVEIVILIKIKVPGGDRYHIDSIQIAG